MDSTRGEWMVTHQHLNGYSVQTVVAFDSLNHNRAYCGTWDNGFWKTDDRCQTWDKTPIEIPGFLHCIPFG